MLRLRRSSLPRQGENSKSQVLRTTGGSPSGLYALLVLRSEKEEIVSLREITILVIIELKHGNHQRWNNL